MWSICTAIPGPRRRRPSRIGPRARRVRRARTGRSRPHLDQETGVITAWPAREELTRTASGFSWRVYELRESQGLSAAVYTQITDVETECNGLLTYDRAIVKVDVPKVAAANQGKGPRHSISGDRSGGRHPAHRVAIYVRPSENVDLDLQRFGLEGRGRPVSVIRACPIPLFSDGLEHVGHLGPPRRPPACFESGSCAAIDPFR